MFVSQKLFPNVPDWILHNFVLHFASFILYYRCINEQLAASLFASLTGIGFYPGG